MAYTTDPPDHAPGANEKDLYDNDRSSDSRIEDAASLAQTHTFQPPPLVRRMSPDERRLAEARLRRKIDFRLLPMVVLMYILNYLDRNNIAAAALAGLKTDLKLTSVQFSVSKRWMEVVVGVEIMDVIADVL
jgi:hypothetical protein